MKTTRYEYIAFEYFDVGPKVLRNNGTLIIVKAATKRKARSIFDARYGRGFFNSKSWDVRRRRGEPRTAAE